jgi:hypothetical protein
MRKAQGSEMALCASITGALIICGAYQGTSFAWKSSGQRAVRCDRTIFATRTLCSTSLSHSTCESPSL